MSDGPAGQSSAGDLSDYAVFVHFGSEHERILK